MSKQQVTSLTRLLVVIACILLAVKCANAQAGITANQRLQATRTALIRAGAQLPKVSVRQTELRNGVRLAQWATTQLGVRELTGNNDGPEVEAYLRVTGNRKGESWCGAFQAAANYVLGLIFPNGAGGARNWDRPGNTFYRRNSFGSLDSARVGDRGMFYYRNLGRIGHIAMFVRAGKRPKAGRPVRGFYTIEGNTGSGGGREGAGVHQLFHGSVDFYSASRWSK